MTDDTQRLIGGLVATTKELSGEVKSLRTEVAALNVKLAGLEGGRRALWGLLAAAGIAGGIISQFVQYILPR